MASKKPAAPFVKSADTGTSVSNSLSELEKILRRYGARGFSSAQDYHAHSVTISFIVPDSLKADAVLIPVKLPISILRVYDAMYGQPSMSVRIPEEERQAIMRAKGTAPYNRFVYNPQGYDSKKLAQAERVAWRNLCLWVDAALSAAVAGMQTITEAFFAHAVVGEGGERMIEVVETYQQQLGTGVQHLLTATAEEV